MRKEPSGEAPHIRRFTPMIEGWPSTGKLASGTRVYGSDWEHYGIAERKLDHYDDKTKNIRIALCNKYQVDWTRRLLGLWMLFTTSWFAAWGAYTMSTCSLENVREGPPGPLSTMCEVDFSGWATQYHYFTIWDYATLVGSGVTVPIGIVALSLSVFLVARAFRPH